MSEVLLGELLNSKGITYGVVKPGDYETNGIPLIKAADVENGRVNTTPNFRISREKHQEHSRTELNGGELLITLVGTPGQCAIAPPEVKGFNVVRAVGVFSVNTLADSRFIMYSIQAPESQAYIRNVCNTTVQATLNLGDFKGLPLSIPEINEQKAIAHILGTLDDKIELNRKTNETLEAMAKALFKSWFVDFDPVRAKVEGRPTGLPAEISNLFPDSFEDSELGEIPRGWRVGCLSDCCEITMGQSPPGDTYNEVGEGLPFYQGKTDFRFRFPGRRVYCSSPTREASLGATLISVRAPVGSANIAREVCSIGRGIAALKSRQSADSFVYYLVGTLQGVFESYNSEGTVFGAINGKDLASIQIVMPRTEVIAAFNSQCLPMDESIQSSTLETEHLMTIRNTLLPKLISGEIRIPDAEKMLEEVGI
jgi:type I restriction enzyme S subunit